MEHTADEVRLSVDALGRAVLIFFAVLAWGVAAAALCMLFIHDFGPDESRAGPVAGGVSAVFLGAALLWPLHRAERTFLTATALEQRTLLGTTAIRWIDVRDISLEQNRLLVVHGSGRARIVVPLGVSSRPEEFVREVRSRATEAKGA